MEHNEYEVMFQVEDSYWWYIALKATVFSFIKKYAPITTSGLFLDAGCGTGSILEGAQDYYSVGFDIAPEAIQFCRKRRLPNILQASVCEIPLPAQQFDIVVSLDVICNVGKPHIDTAIQEFSRVLKPGGILILNLPAYNFLQSQHDKAVHIRHRFIRRELQAKLISAGFKVEKLTYRNTLLFPLIAMVRLGERVFHKRNSPAKSDLKPLPGPINRFLVNLLALETKLLLSKINFPFGLSLFCVARKPEKG